MVEEKGQQDILKTTEEVEIDFLPDELELIKSVVNRNQRGVDDELTAIKAVSRRIGQELVPYRIFYDRWGKGRRIELRDLDGVPRGNITIEWFSEDEDEFRIRTIRYNIDEENRTTILFSWQPDADADYALRRVEVRRTD